MTGIKRYILFLPVVVVGLLVLGYVTDFYKDPKNSATHLEGERAPEVHLSLLESPKTKAAFPEKGKVTVINFFSSWCRYSRHEHNVLRELAGYMKSHDFSLVGVVVHDTRDAAVKWLGAVGNPYARVFFDDTRASVQAWMLLGTPTLFVVDKKGVVQFVHSGMLTDEILRAHLLPLLPKR